MGKRPTAGPALRLSLSLACLVEVSDKLLRLVQYFVRFLAEAVQLPSPQPALSLKAMSGQCLQVRRLLRFFRHTALARRLAVGLGILGQKKANGKWRETLVLRLKTCADFLFLLFLLAEHLIYLEQHQPLPHLQVLHPTTLLLSDVAWLCESIVQLVISLVQLGAVQTRSERRTSRITAGKNLADILTIYGLLTDRFAPSTPYFIGSLSSLLSLSLYLA